MIGYITLGTDNLAPAAEFYDRLLAELNASRLMEAEDFIVWSNGSGAGFSLHRPADGQPFSVGNGVMIALQVANADTVKRLHARALELGGSDEGAPGFRAEGFYAAYFRDLDGHKLNFHALEDAAEA